MPNPSIVWDDSESFMLPEERNTNRSLAEHISTLGYAAIVKSYTYIDSHQINALFNQIPQATESFKGIGIDLGGGASLVSCSIAQSAQVKKVYCVESVVSVVNLLQPIVKAQILGAESDKVLSVIGNYDQLQLEDQSIDFAVAWDSMHHSPNPVNTLRECARVLKPSGTLVVVDRAHNNETPDTEIQRMLDIVYDAAFLKSSYRDPTIKLTRRENGENEYRYREWEKFFGDAGFQISHAVEILGGQSDHTFEPNDAGIKQVHFPHHVGGFANKKIAYALSKLSSC